VSDTELLPNRIDPAARRDRGRRRSFKRRGAAAAAIGIPAGLVIALAAGRLGGGKPVATPRPVGNGAEGQQVTYLLVGMKAGDISGQADWLSVLAIDRDGRNPLTVFIPTGTLTQIPGFGYDAVGKAMALGRVPLQEITVENLLGVMIDHTLLVPDTLLSHLVDRAGGIDVTIPSALMAAQGTNRLVPVFQPGGHHLNGPAAMRYVEYQGPDENELARFERERTFWEALYGLYLGDRAPKLADLVSGFGAQLVTDSPPSAVGAFFASFASAGPDARVYRTLPVDAIGAGGGADAFRLNVDQYQADLAKLLAPSRPGGQSGSAVRVQILNGNGRPEVGLAVAGVLVPAGFRVAATGNASSFRYGHTVILVYRNEDLPIAQRIRTLLGVGQIEVSGTQQTIVDVTIVVGSDFVPKSQ